jgi:hypothetical protein
MLEKLQVMKHGIPSLDRVNDNSTAQSEERSTSSTRLHSEVSTYPDAPTSTTQRISTTPVTKDDMTTTSPPSRQQKHERSDYLAAMEVLEKLASLSEEQKVQVGFQAENLIVDCEFAGVDCSQRCVLY